MSFTAEQLKEMAQQLSCPNGDFGTNVADMMHDSNFGMTTSAIKALSIGSHEQVLELGHGNGKHIRSILQEAANVSYFGLEISALMKKEAEALQLDQSSFYLYDGQNIPFEEEQFNKAMTVNTIYFWQDPVYLLHEVYRVLRPKGRFAIAFAQKDFMETLPFTQYGFNLYDNAKLEELVKQSPFKLVSLTHQTEMVKSKANEMVERLYTVAILEK